MTAGRRPRPRSALSAGGRLGVALLAVVVGLVVLAPIVTPFDPTEQVLRDRLLPPAWVGGGTSAHPFGTDANGRDLLARILFGGRLSLLIALGTVTIGAAIGVSAGILAGWRGGWPGAILGRLADIQQSIPFVILALAVVAVAGASVVNVVLVLGIGSWFAWFRIVRGEVLALRERPFVEAARAMGADGPWIARAHLLPNVLPSLVTLATLWIPQAIVYTAGLTFLGLGVPPPTPEWGRLIADGTDSIGSAWWLALLPSAALLVTVAGLTLAGDWLRERMDPARRPA
jgi:peptide/nickel transport system permease protein